MGATVVHDHGRIYEFVRRRLTFFTNQVYIRRGDEWVKIDKPDDARLDTFSDQILLHLRSDWTIGGMTYPAGALSLPISRRTSEAIANLQCCSNPPSASVWQDTSPTKNYLIINELENVRNKLSLLRHESGQWIREALDTPALGSIHARGIDPDESDDYFLIATDFLTPSSLYFGTVGQSEPENSKVSLCSLQRMASSLANTRPGRKTAQEFLIFR